MYHALRQALVRFDEYTVENFHSSKTNATDNADQINLKAKEIDTCKHEMHSFKSMFVPPRKLNFSRKTIEKLKFKAAQFLTNKFGELHTNSGQAVLYSLGFKVTARR